MIYRRILIALAALAALPASAAALRAQVFTPSFQTPGQRAAVGAVVSGGIGPGDGYAVEGLVRRSYGPLDLGLRVGLADLQGVALLVGLEYRNPIAIPDAPVDVAVTAAAQGILGGQGGPGVAAGATAGRSFVLPAGTITPYLHPRLALFDLQDGGRSPDLALLVELGADFALASDLRFHLALGVGGESANLGFGLLWR